MKFKITTKILFGYAVAFILFLAFAILTLSNGKKIEQTTSELSQRKLPSLVVISEIKSDLQLQTNYLYELYATNNLAEFNKNQFSSTVRINTNLKKLDQLYQKNDMSKELNTFLDKQLLVSKRFVQTMSQPDVDWDMARAGLTEYRIETTKTDEYLNSLVQEVSKETNSTANQSLELTTELINSAFILGLVEIFVIIVMIYGTIKFVAQPLMNLTASINDLAIRKNLNYRFDKISNDEIGDIATATNGLIEELQKLALTLHKISGEVSSTTTNLSKITSTAKKSMLERNSKLIQSSKKLMQEIQQEAKSSKNLDPDSMKLQSAQMEFMHGYMLEISEDGQQTEKNINNLEVETGKLNKLLDTLFDQIRTLHY